MGELSYAEPGKATLTDQLRLLTTQESLDTRTLAVTRAVHRLYKGIPGVHSIDDSGVTRLYLRLKCRRCGKLLNNLQSCMLCKTLPPVDDAAQATSSLDGPKELSLSLHSEGPQPTEGEVGWYAPHGTKGCLFDTRGYEMFSKA